MTFQYHPKHFLFFFTLFRITNCWQFFNLKLPYLYPQFSAFPSLFTLTYWSACVSLFYLTYQEFLFRAKPLATRLQVLNSFLPFPASVVYIIKVSLDSQRVSPTKHTVFNRSSWCLHVLPVWVLMTTLLVWLEKERVHLIYVFQRQSVIKGSRGRNSGRDRNHRGMLLTALFSTACPACFFYTTRAPLARGWTLPHRPLIKECLQTNLMEVSSGLRIPLPRWLQLCRHQPNSPLLGSFHALVLAWLPLLTIAFSWPWLTGLHLAFSH